MSQLRFDAELLPRLEALYETEDVRRRRRLVREALAAAPGDRVLDAGCGPGFYATELLRDVGSTGSVVGVDRSAEMLAAARHRTEGLANLTFLEGDVTALPVDDAAFDAALCVQVLEYVPDTGAALTELHRALAPGGRLVVWDVDWSTTSLHSGDEARTQRVLGAWDGHLAHPTLPRVLPSRLRDAGFEDVRLDAHAFATDRFVPGTYLGTILGLVEAYVAGLGDDAAEDVRGWIGDLRDLDAQGAFYAAVTQVRVAARRPGA